VTKRSYFCCWKKQGSNLENAKKSEPFKNSKYHGGYHIIVAIISLSRGEHNKSGDQKKELMLHLEQKIILMAAGAYFQQKTFDFLPEITEFYLRN